MKHKLDGGFGISILSEKGPSKMKWLMGFYIIIFSFLTLSSCVTLDEFRRTNDEIIALNRRVNKLQETIDAKLGGDLESRLKPVQVKQAEAGAEMDELRKEVHILSGRVEESEHIVKRVVERDLSEQDAMQASLVLLSQKVTELEATVKYQQEYLGLDPLAPQRALEKGAVDRKKTVLKPTGAVKEPKSKELELYDSSLVAFKEERYEDAKEDFKRFLKTYPKSDRADNAQFWIGECLMALKQYEQAILAYQEVIKKYPKGNKVPNAMLRQATAFSMIDDKISTRLLLKKVVQKYPKSNEAKIARKRLKTLK